jgi:hypothetical protein
MTENKWIWYLLTFGGSFIPFLARLLVSLEFPINSFDIKDILFAGLAMNLSNFNLTNIEESKKSRLIIFSGLSIFFIGLIIGIFLCAEYKEPANNNIYLLKLVSYAFVAFSIRTSYNANSYSFKTIDL